MTSLILVGDFFTYTDSLMFYCKNPWTHVIKPYLPLCFVNIIPLYEYNFSCLIRGKFIKNQFLLRIDKK